MLASDDAALRAFLARILGYEPTLAIEHALRSIDLGVTRRVTLVLVGDTDMVLIALTLHRRTLGADRPFGGVFNWAAARLALSHVALTQWLDRHRRWRARWGGP